MCNILERTVATGKVDAKMHDQSKLGSLSGKGKIPKSYLISR